MTGSAPGRAEPADAPISVDPCLARLDQAIEAARALGLATDHADAVGEDAAARLGFPSDAYVLALVGGTGVGKSSLLNALAGTDVSAASVRRPTTDRPVAWLHDAARDELEGLLAWLDVDPADVRSGSGSGLGGATELGSVAILDLPDLDSTAADHRRRVDAILPRVDAVLWVTDPEKYADAALHDDFLTTWVPRLDRQLVVLNKADRLTAADGEAVRRDLERDLARLSSRDANRPDGTGPPVVLASATARPGGDGSGADGVHEVRRWLGDQIETKAIVRARLMASIRDAIAGLAGEAGIGRGGSVPPAPLLDDAARSQAVDGSTAALLRIVDLPSLERQAVAATRARARARGAGPLGRLTSLVYRWSGREAKVADPVAFLARWRDRGSLSPAVEPIREAIAGPMRAVPAGTRRLLAERLEPEGVERELARAVDRAVALRGGDPPSSRIWTLLGIVQTVTTLALVATAIWVALWILVKFPVDSITLPVVGRVPVPLVILIDLLAAGYIIARLLGAHAGWTGRRWARSLAAEVRSNVRRDVASSAFAAVDAIDADRRLLAAAAVASAVDCRRE